MVKLVGQSYRQLGLILSVTTDTVKLFDFSSVKRLGSNYLTLYIKNDKKNLKIQKVAKYGLSLIVLSTKSKETRNKILERENILA